MNDIPIKTPAGYAPAFAIGTRRSDGSFALVGPDAPIAVSSAVGPVPAALSGETSESVVAGPFEPSPFTPVYLTLSGSWTGSVRLLRSTDGGATKVPVTVGGAQWAQFADNACEPVWSETEAGATLWLELAPMSGTIEWRLSQ